ARTGHAGEDRETAFGEVDGHILRVVLPCSADADEVMAVGRVHLSQLLCWVRIMFPAGSRSARSRRPEGWSIGSCTISAASASTSAKTASTSALSKTWPA